MTDARRLSDAATGAAGWATRERSAEIRAWFWTTFVALLLYALILGGSWAGIYWVSLRILSLALITMGLLAWLVLALRWPRLRPSTAIWPAIALPPMTLALSALASPFQRLGLEYVAWATLLAALYLLLVRILARPYARARIGALAAILGIALGVAYIGSVLILWTEWWILLDGLVAPPMRPLFVGLTWGNPSAVLTIEVLLLLIAAAGLGTGSRRASVTLTVLAVMTFFVVVMSGSRAGWLAVAGASVIVGGIWVSPDIWRRVKSLRMGLATALSDRRTVIALVVCGILAIFFIPGILARVENGGDGGRPLYYTIAMRMFADNPVLGLGPGTWAARRVAYTDQGELDFIAPHAHDIYLQTAAELGIVGLAVGLIALACVAWLALGAIRGDRPERRRWAWAAVVALVYLGLHSVLDFYANMPAVLLLVAIPVAMLDATTDRRLGLPARLQPLVGSIRALAFGTLIVASGMAILVLGRSESVALAHQAAVDAANDSDWRAAFPPAFRAARDDPGVAPYQQTLGIAAAGVGAWRTAAGAFETAARIDDLPASWLGLAVAQQRNGEPAEIVASSLRKALRLGVQQAAVAFGAGQVYDRIGMPAAADSAYVDALLRLPELAAASSWGRVGVGPERFERLVTRAIERSPASGWRLALMAGEVDRARSIAQESGQSYATLVIDAWTGDQAAVGWVRSIAEKRVFDMTSLTWAALVSAHIGDDESAARYQRLLRLAFPDAGSTRLVAIGDRSASRDTAIGTNSANYGNYMYRRASPVDLIVPDLPSLSLAVRASTGPPADSASARRDDR